MGCLQSSVSSTSESIAALGKTAMGNGQGKFSDEIPSNDACTKTEEVKLSAMRNKDGFSNTLFRQDYMLSFESSHTGSSLSLSDLETYQKKKFPKFRGYRKCKYCTQTTSLPSSFKTNDVNNSDEKHSVGVQSESERKGGASKSRDPAPRGLPTRDSCRRCSTKIAKNSSKLDNSVNSFNHNSSSVQFVNLLALNALDLTAPASDALLKNRKNAWVQLAGHPGAFAPAGPDSIWKKRLTKDDNEVKAYDALMNDAARNMVPTFYREVEFNGDFFIEMEDLLHHFHDPNIMDIKMGSRTFLEAEVKNPVLRKDLYEKMVRLDPDAPTDEEHQEKAITKLRYMQFREGESSTASLGFRLEAIRVSGQTPVTDLKKVKTKEEVGLVIGRFISGRESIRKSIAEKLVKLRTCFEQSDFFKHHELIGSSLLVMFDKRGETGVWMIDFAKTLPVDVALTHRAPWSVGNHEDGYLIGLDNLIQVFESMSFSPSNGMENLSFSSEQTTENNVT